MWLPPRLAASVGLTTTFALSLALSCAPREVDVGVGEGGACDYGASAGDEEARLCADGYRCEPVAGGEGAYVCAAPVLLRGQIFDAVSGEPLAGALVAALDRTSAPVSDVTASAADGSYELEVAALRDAEGKLASAAIYTLQVFANDYAPFPSGIRPALPISSTDGVEEPIDDDDGDGDGETRSRLVIETPTTSVGLIPLPPGQRGGGTIHGTVGGPLPGGTLVVAEGVAAGDGAAPYGLADRSGEFTIFNVAPGSVTVVGYRGGAAVTPAAVEVVAGMIHEVTLAAADTLGAISGSVNIVDAPGSARTSVVLVPSAVFNPTLERGPVPYALRAPAPGIDPDVSGAFAIDGVPPGTYKVLAAFENDGLVRDPDETIAGTSIVEIEVGPGAEIVVPESFKVTGALAVRSPGAESPEAVGPTPTLVFEDDSSEDRYAVLVYDALGTVVWEDDAVPGVTGNPDVIVDYGGPALTPGMWYQFRATSIRDTPRETRLSRTEDLRGVFFRSAETAP